MAGAVTTCAYISSAPAGKPSHHSDAVGW